MGLSRLLRNSSNRSRPSATACRYVIPRDQVPPELIGQICPPRAPQLALAPLLSSLRDDLAAASSQLAHRRKLFHDTVSSVPGWSVDSMGGFFAYVSFPDQYASAKELSSPSGVAGSEEVAKFLAEHVGVVTLPGRFFMPDGFESLPAAEKLRADRWIR